MLDLMSLRDASSFDPDPSADTRLALVHQGFRSALIHHGQDRVLGFYPRLPSLGLLNLAHALRADARDGRVPARLEFRYFEEEDFDGDDDLARAVEEWLAATPRRALLVSTYTKSAERVERFLRLIDFRRVLVVVGGAHATLAPEMDGAHISVRGEGLTPMRHILTQVLGPGFGAGDDARGICYRVGDQTTLSPPAFDTSIATAEPPAFAYDLLGRDAGHDPARFHTHWTRAIGERPQIYICTQSCRARCTFCATYVIHGHTVARPVERIAEDLDTLVGELGHDCIEFHDDDLLQHDEFDALMALLEEIGIPWFCYGRVDLITRDVALRMRRAGCRRIFLGCEAMRQDTLDYYRKGTTVEMNRAAVSHLDTAGIGVISGFIIGAPHDTTESILDEIDRFLDLPLFAVHVSVLNPDISTVEFHRARRRQPEDFARLGDRPGRVRRVTPNVEAFGTGNPFGFPSVCASVTKAELNALQDLATVQFYLREHVWRRLWRELPPVARPTLVDHYRWVLESADQLLEAPPSAAVSSRVAACLAHARGGDWLPDRVTRPAGVTTGSVAMPMGARSHRSAAFRGSERRGLRA